MALRQKVVYPPTLVRHTNHLVSDIYGDEFYATINGVTNALDNVKARTALPLYRFDALTVLRIVHGSTLCVLQEAIARVRHSGH